jgi:hypothetical protein
VEVAPQGEVVAIRNSADHGSFLAVSAASWKNFIRDVKGGLIQPGA